MSTTVNRESGGHDGLYAGKVGGKQRPVVLLEEEDQRVGRR